MVLKMTKFALILGASGDIGSEIARQLAAQGWSLYLHYSSNVRRIDALWEELQHNFPEQQFSVVQCDLSHPEHVPALTQSIFELHAIIVAHGMELLKLVEDTTDEEMELLWKVHVHSPIKVMNALMPKLKQHSSSYIVVIGSIWGHTGAANEVLYSTVKGAQHAFVRAYAKEVASLGIRVNGIAPGWIDTRMNASFDEEELQAAHEVIPLRTIGQPIDVAQAVTFLVSGQADYMVGEIMNINGGWYIA